MNLAELQKKLLRAARSSTPGEQVPYAFEQRVMAHLRSQPRPDPLAWWTRSLWRAAAGCAAIAILAIAWSLVPLNASSAGADLAVQLEDAVLASVEDGEMGW